MAKLLSHHDPYHFHAICGLLVLIHFFYRFPLICLDVKDGGFGTNWITDILSLLVIALLPITSFLFKHVPVHKLGTDGFTIWKEYRWHAVIFSFKAWVLLAIYIFERHFYPEGFEYMEAYRIIVVFVTRFCAKMATDSFPPQVSTIRGMYKNTWSVFAAGFIQFLGTAAIMCGTPKDDMAIAYVATAIIQFNALNMTLRKKRIISATASQAYYSCMLGSSFYLFAVRRFMAEPPEGFFDPRLKFIYTACIAYFCRVILTWDRFVSWTIALLCVRVAKTQLGLFEYQGSAM